MNRSTAREADADCAAKNITAPKQAENVMSPNFNSYQRLVDT
jgi:hypothetical protein